MAAPAADLPLPTQSVARMVRHPEHAAIQALTRAGTRLVAVGERGVVLLSDDEGRQWRQSRVPVSVTLTAVSFADSTQGWAVGHGGVVLHSADGGETWLKQIDGAELAHIALVSADRWIARGAAAGEALSRVGKQLVSDGPDKPLLDVSFTTPSRGVVVGAYGLAFMTLDGGKTWESLMDRIDNPSGYHFNAVKVQGDTTVVAGEQGLLARSTDGLKSFTRLQTPYKGSYFALALLPTGEIVVGGVKGNVFLSADAGTRWRKVDLPVPSAVTALSVNTDGSLLVVTQVGLLYRLAAGAAAVAEVATKRLPMLSTVMPTRDGSFVLGGLVGLARGDASEKRVSAP